MSPSLSLGPAEAHVWVHDMRRESQWGDGAVLSDLEQERAGAMRAAERRNAFVRGRSAARHLAAQYLGVAATEIVLREGETGKPLLLTPDASPLHLSISHSGDHLAVAFTRAGEIGVDVEAWSTDRDHGAISRRFFRPAEAKAIEGKGARPFVDAWVCKEAVLKAVGVGLAGLGDVELALDGPVPTLHALAPALGAPAVWTLSMFDAAPRMSAAVAVRAPGVAVIVRR